MTKFVFGRLSTISKTATMQRKHLSISLMKDMIQWHCLSSFNSSNYLSLRFIRGKLKLMMEQKNGVCEDLMAHLDGEMTGILLGRKRLILVTLGLYRIFVAKMLIVLRYRGSNEESSCVRQRPC